MIKYGVVIQARMGSSRRPGKISHLIEGFEMLRLQLERLKSNGINNIFVATSDKKEDDITQALAEKSEIKCFRGSETNLIRRFYDTCQSYNIQNMVRVGGDDPLIDPGCISALISAHATKPADFIYASHRTGWIYGTAAELISIKVLEEAIKDSLDDVQKEHTVPYIKGNNKFSQYKISPNEDSLIRPDIYVSVDYNEDIKLIEDICHFFSKKEKLFTFSQSELIDLYDSGEIIIGNKHLHSGFDE
ncbi:cytidylyltransferase domain-containing protein [Asinibacterium sp. OR53]|uniref:cytidylyltransferase domain-containing protein n=1 Tax=Asinibacterium sp. OR53 TaxID=925409 RepID=UPI00047A7F1F|nr:hypothetical protein [Asinibacterium sp. OR53]